jgi:hypothetical protein
VLAVGLQRRASTFHDGILFVTSPLFMTSSSQPAPAPLPSFCLEPAEGHRSLPRVGALHFTASCCTRQNSGEVARKQCGC